MQLELKNVTKAFGDFVANDSISLTVEPGQVHTLLGENGAGKSTLMNVLFGLYQPTAGEILLNGQPVRFSGPGDAMARGIGMVHQHFMLVPVFTVAENIALGHEDTKGGRLDLKTTARKVREISARFGFDIDPDALVEDLPVGVQQRVEIIKALIRDAELLILDEPTAVLTPQETDELLRIIKQLRDGGTSIIFISHKLREVKEISDVITVIRRGKVVGTADPSASSSELASLMVGRDVQLNLNRVPAEGGSPALEVKNLSVVATNGTLLLDDVSLSVAEGEVLAVAGVQGNGQTELVESIMGLRPVQSGSVSLHGDVLTGRPVKEVLRYGVGYVPEDRNVEGLVGEFSVAENLVLDQLDRPEIAGRLSLHRAAVARNASDKIEEFDIRTGSASAAASTLSGGNQQKIVLAREFSRPLRLLVASQPTRGVDVGSIEFLHRRILRERDTGTAVVLVSTELDEVLEMGDRIAVMYHGKLMGIVPGGTSREVLGLMMAGSTAEEAFEAAAGSAQPGSEENLV
ncbi:ABC transporter ATP-binding protein [Galactobacter valiniphilus]|uniref:ABC transporter ATP-binding protein n=1 Tax=Galactobacter valiniphilus TaxID=2676122 RepID=A0A399JCR8_9MICC|nr:ABC transporter ATP-binding protein [Galactobacter valiniphilus]RII42870.1 ABC transporter ATP-binding protein [Galactobacter valiniphilus]